MGLTLSFFGLNGKKSLPMHIFTFPELALIQEGLLTTVVYRAGVC